jgi:hypothetical protein
MRTPPAYSALGFSKRKATALINGVLFQPVVIPHRV